MLSVMVCGSRGMSVGAYEVWDWVDELVREYEDYDVRIIVGDCPTGADAAVHQAAVSRNWKLDRFEADWSTHGRAAGPIRNQQMIDAKPDFLLAWWDGESRGTLDSIRRAVKAGICVQIAPDRKGRR